MTLIIVNVIIAIEQGKNLEKLTRTKGTKNEYFETGFRDKNNNTRRHHNGYGLYGILWNRRIGSHRIRR